MIVNTKGVTVNENVYIQKEGKYLLKIEKFETDGFTQSGDEKFKLFFKGMEVGVKEPIYSHSEGFNVGQNSLWRIKQLEIALQAPECYDIQDFVGRYIVANVKSEEYTKKDGGKGMAYKVKSWEYSNLNDKLPPIPEAKQDENDVPEIDINDDEIPF